MSGDEPPSVPNRHFGSESSSGPRCPPRDAEARSTLSAAARPRPTTAAESFGARKGFGVLRAPLADRPGCRPTSAHPRVPVLAPGPPHSSGLHPGPVGGRGRFALTESLTRGTGCLFAPTGVHPVSRREQRLSEGNGIPPLVGGVSGRTSWPANAPQCLTSPHGPGGFPGVEHHRELSRQVIRRGSHSLACMTGVYFPIAEVIPEEGRTKRDILPRSDVRMGPGRVTPAHEHQSRGRSRRPGHKWSKMGVRTMRERGPPRDLRRRGGNATLGAGCVGGAVHRRPVDQLRALGRGWSPSQVTRSRGTLFAAAGISPLWSSVISRRESCRVVWRGQ